VTKVLTVDEALDRSFAPPVWFSVVEASEPWPPEDPEQLDTIDMWMTPPETENIVRTLVREARRLVDQAVKTAQDASGESSRTGRKAEGEG
jgi:hypothetical protein